jgi:hypothetical protein
MKFRNLTLALASLALLAATARADEKKPAEGAPPGMSEADMKAMMAAGTPGPEHKHLASMAGDWTFTTTFWMAPGAPPQTSTGTMKAETMMGGRYLKETWNGDMMGMPFEGQALMGYDNVAKKHYSTWIDSMSTGMMTSWGDCDQGMKSCTFSGKFWDPVSAKETTSRMQITWVDDNTFKNEMWGPGPDGKEMKMMEIVAKRKM